MQTETRDERLTEAQLDDIARIASATESLVRDDEEERVVASAVEGLRRIGEELAPRMARELRRLYDIEGANIIHMGALRSALERERVLRVEAEQLRAELARANRQSDDGILGEGGVSQWG